MAARTTWSHQPPAVTRGHVDLRPGTLRQVASCLRASLSSSIKSGPAKVPSRSKILWIPGNRENRLWETECGIGLLELHSAYSWTQKIWQHENTQIHEEKRLHRMICTPKGPWDTTWKQIDIRSSCITNYRIHSHYRAFLKKISAIPSHWLDSKHTINSIFKAPNKGGKRSY